MVRKFLKKFFEIPGGPRNWFSVVLWWELRRIPYNMIMGLAGLLSLSLFLWIDELTSAPWDDWSPALSVMFFGLMANICYTGGWIVELGLGWIWPQKTKMFGPVALKRGLVFSIAVSFLPTLINLLEYLYRRFHS